MNTGYLADLERAIQLRCRCSTTHLQTVFVHEKTEDNETIWFGYVEVFDLAGCTDASKCYAWLNTEKGIRVVTVLHTRVVDSPRRAVQLAIFAEIQPPMISSVNDTATLKGRVEEAKRLLLEAQLNAEGLEAIMQTVRQTRESIFRKRQ